MHVVTNEKLVRTKLRYAWIFHLSAFIIYAGGLWFSSTRADQQSFETTAAIFGAIIVGLILYSFGQVSLRRYGPRARQDAILTRALKGLDNRFTLLAFPDPKLPDYILVGPQAVRVIVARNHGGQIACRHDRWTREGGGLGRFFTFFGGSPLGDPGYDLARGVQAVRERLRQRGLAGDEEPPVDGLVVFTNPAAKLRIEGCSSTVTGLKQFRNYVRPTKGGPTMNQQTLAEIVRALEE